MISAATNLYDFNRQHFGSKHEPTGATGSYLKLKVSFHALIQRLSVCWMWLLLPAWLVVEPASDCKTAEDPLLACNPIKTPLTLTAPRPHLKMSLDIDQMTIRKSAILMTSSSSSLATITIHAQQLNDVWDHSRPKQLSNLQAVILEKKGHSKLNPTMTHCSSRNSVTNCH